MLNNPFFQVALPIMFSILVAAWLNSKGFYGITRRLDDLRSDMNILRSDMNTRLNEVNRSLKNIEAKLDKPWGAHRRTGRAYVLSDQGPVAGGDSGGIRTRIVPVTIDRFRGPDRYGALFGSLNAPPQRHGLQ